MTGKLCVAAVVGALAIAGYVDRPDFDPPTVVSQPPLNDREQRVAELLIRHGAAEPTRLARAIVRTKRPKIAAAQAVVESNGRNVTGAAGEKGIWQIIEREHGVVPDSIEGQAEKWEAVFEAYVRQSRGNVRQALCMYNSGRPDRSGRYADRVLVMARGL